MSDSDPSAPRVPRAVDCPYVVYNDSEERTQIWKAGDLFLVYTNEDGIRHRLWGFWFLANECPLHEESDVSESGEPWGVEKGERVNFLEFT